VSERKLWRLQIDVLAERDEADALAQNVGALLCPDPNHSGSCVVPWEITILDEVAIGRRTSAEVRKALQP
jgi:hypothetical protein